MIFSNFGKCTRILYIYDFLAVLIITICICMYFYHLLPTEKYSEETSVNQPATLKHKFHFQNFTNSLLSSLLPNFHSLMKAGRCGGKHLEKVWIFRSGPSVKS